MSLIKDEIGDTFKSGIASIISVFISVIPCGQIIGLLTYLAIKTLFNNLNRSRHSSLPQLRNEHTG